MAQRRMISAALWSDLDFVALTMRQRLLWIALITNADDQGRLQGHPALVRSLCFPVEDVPLADIEADLAALAALGWILRYEAAGKTYLQLAKWWRHQTMTWAQPSEHPAPDGWEDSMRYRRKGSNEVVTVHWDKRPEWSPTAGGVAYIARTYAVHTEDDEPAGKMPDNITEYNLTEQKRKEKNTPAARPSSPPASAKVTKPATDVILELWHAYQRGMSAGETQTMPATAAKALQGLVADGRTPADVEAFTRYQGGNPYWHGDGIPLSYIWQYVGKWIADGRPAMYVAKPTGSGQGPPAPASEPKGFKGLRAYMAKQQGNEHESEAAAVNG